MRLDDGEHTAMLDQFGIGTSFACLVLRGRLHKIVIRDQFRFDQDITAVADATSHHLGGFGRQDQSIFREHMGRRSWRKVYSPLKPNIVAGWGSLEHPSLTDDDVSQTGDAIFAFRISIVHGIPYGFNVGNVLPFNDGYNVIFLRHVQDHQYERVGVGGPFGRKSKKQRDMAVDQEIELV